MNSVRRRSSIPPETPINVLERALAAPEIALDLLLESTIVERLDIVTPEEIDLSKPGWVIRVYRTSNAGSARVTITSLSDAASLPPNEPSGLRLGDLRTVAKVKADPSNRDIILIQPLEGCKAKSFSTEQLELINSFLHLAQAPLSAKRAPEELQREEIRKKVNATAAGSETELKWKDILASKDAEMLITKNFKALAIFLPLSAATATTTFIKETILRIAQQEGLFCEEKMLKDPSGKVSPVIFLSPNELYKHKKLPASLVSQLVKLPHTLFR